jgi:hypothetical protein
MKVLNFAKSISLTLLFSGSVLFAAAQDSTAKAAVKPTVKPKTAWAPTNTYPAQKPAAQPAPYGQPVVPAPVVNTDKSLNGQYQYLLTKLYAYQRPQLSAFYKNLTDTIRTQRKQLKDAQSKLGEQSKTVKDLQADVTTKEQSLNESTTKRDAIDLAGMTLSKTTYNMIMWGLVIAFGAIAVLFMLQGAAARREAKYRVKLYEDLDEEHKVYKQKANEKEKKLARELQTARNQLEDLTGNPGY